MNVLAREMFKETIDDYTLVLLNILATSQHLRFLINFSVAGSLKQFKNTHNHTYKNSIITIHTLISTCMSYVHIISGIGEKPFHL